MQFETFWHKIYCEHSVPQALCQVLYIHDLLLSVLREGVSLSPVLSRRDARLQEVRFPRSHIVRQRHSFNIQTLVLPNQDPFDAGGWRPMCSLVPLEVWQVGVLAISCSHSADILRTLRCKTQEGTFWPQGPPPQTGASFCGLSWSLELPLSSKA